MPRSSPALGGKAQLPAVWGRGILAGGAIAGRPSRCSSMNHMQATDFGALVGPVWQRLQRQLGFIVEIDKLKQVLRQTPLMDGSRRETDAEHSWHIALMAVLLAEHAASPDLDLLKVVKMLLLHDLVEIDAGDTFCYDSGAVTSQDEREALAADRVFGLLPADQAAEFRALWEEFEARQTPEAAYAAALDRLQPLLHNYQAGGGTWLLPGVTAEKMRARKAPIEAGSPILFEFVQGLLRDAAARGILPHQPW